MAQTKTQTEITPPGCIWLTDNIYIDETEIANINWIEYLFYIRRDLGEAAYLRALPDTTVWANISDKYVKNYLRYTGFRHCPVVGLTQQQAINYCNWRRSVVTKGIAKDNTKHFKRFKKYLKQGYEIKVTYRLPTQSEWLLAAASKLDTNLCPYGTDKIDTSRSAKCVEFNRKKYGPNHWSNSFHLRNNNCDKNPNDTAFSTTCNIYMYPPNDILLYQMLGNVSELIAEPNVAMGGNFNTTFADLKSVNYKKYYTRPENWIGFRCVGVVQLIPKNQLSLNP